MIIAEALFGDLELRDNVLTNICQYQILNQGLQVRSTGAILEGYRQQLKDAKIYGIFRK